MGGSDLGEVSVSAAINIGDRDDMRAGGEGLQNDSGGSGARGKGEGIAGVLERRDGFLEVIPAAVALSAGSARGAGGEGSYLFGFELLVYSYSPMGLPTADWAKVVEREIWRRVSGES